MDATDRSKKIARIRHWTGIGWVYDGVVALKNIKTHLTTYLSKKGIEKANELLRDNFSFVAIEGAKKGMPKILEVVNYGHLADLFNAIADTQSSDGAVQSGMVAADKNKLVEAIKHLWPMLLEIGDHVLWDFWHVPMKGEEQIMHTALDRAVKATHESIITGKGVQTHGLSETTTIEQFAADRIAGCVVENCLTTRSIAKQLITSALESIMDSYVFTIWKHYYGFDEMIDEVIEEAIEDRAINDTLNQTITVQSAERLNKMLNMMVGAVVNNYFPLDIGALGAATTRRRLTETSGERHGFPGTLPQRRRLADRLAALEKKFGSGEF